MRCALTEFIYLSTFHKILSQTLEQVLLEMNALEDMLAARPQTLEMWPRTDSVRLRKKNDDDDSLVLERKSIFSLSSERSEDSLYIAPNGKSVEVCSINVLLYWCRSN